MVLHGFKTFILLNCLICLGPYFTTEVTLCLVKYMKTWLFSLWILGPKLGFVPVVANPGMKFQPCALRLIILKRQGQKQTNKNKLQNSSLLHRWCRAALTEGLGCRPQGHQWDKEMECSSHSHGQHCFESFDTNLFKGWARGMWVCGRPLAPGPPWDAGPFLSGVCLFASAPVSLFSLSVPCDCASFGSLCACQVGA